VDPALWRPIDIPVQFPDTTKLKRTVPWSQEFPLERTLTDLVDYWRKKVE